MLRKETSVVGINLNEHEIHAVQVKFKSGRPFVTKAGSVTTPKGAYARGIVYEPEILAVALRRLLDSMKLNGPVRAVMGLAGESVHYRNLAVPPCPESEIPVLVAGEVQYQHLVASDSIFDHIRLYPPVDEGAEGISVSVVSVGLEFTTALREVAERADVEIVAFEPASLAVLRTASYNLPATANAFVLIVGTTVTDAAFFVGGRLAAIRRIDVGSASLLMSMGPSGSYEDPAMEMGWTPPTDEAPDWHIDGTAADRLAVEAQRTLEYVQREDPERTAIDCVHLSVNGSELEPLAAWIESRIGAPVQFVSPPQNPADAPEATLAVEQSHGLPFVAAYGLAAHSASAPSNGIVVPRVDLDSVHRSQILKGETQRYFVGSLLVSAAAVGLGILGCSLYNRQISRVESRSKAATTMAASIRSETERLLTERSDKAMRYAVLRKEGVPLGTIMDYVVGSIDPAVGLKTVVVTEDLRVRIGGEAKDENVLVRATQNLQQSPVLSDLVVNRFERETKFKDGVLTFELSGMTVSADRLQETQKVVGKS